ncbi:MAG TPA: hypothetical protein H9784_04420 [Candidatus Desulfovibrio intestinavium]|uniref:Uncharacterized protein n=1 Tax=Candidatus Desulfovibrio intestinavium TaxID=2838534 RepID=A0A9D2HN78_9BACT|nr:hypothetical protein [Candidatus Desulfovibrio intestinavium]
MLHPGKLLAGLLLCGGLSGLTAQAAPVREAILCPDGEARPLLVERTRPERPHWDNRYGGDRRRPYWDRPEDRRRPVRPPYAQPPQRPYPGPYGYQPPPSMPGYPFGYDPRPPRQAYPFGYDPRNPQPDYPFGYDPRRRAPHHEYYDSWDDPRDDGHHRGWRKRGHHRRHDWI